MADDKQPTMKVHTFQVNIGNNEIRGFSKSKKPVFVKKIVELEDLKTKEKLRIDPLQWEYLAEARWEWDDYKGSAELRERFAAIKRGEYAIGALPREKLVVLLVPLELDVCELTVIIVDKPGTMENLMEFIRTKLAEYTVKDVPKFGERTPVYTVSGRTDCVALGVDTNQFYHDIRRQGFHIRIDKVYSGLEAMERAVLWKVEEKAVTMGVNITRFEIKSITMEDTGEVITRDGVSRVVTKDTPRDAVSAALDKVFGKKEEPPGGGS